MMLGGRMMVSCLLALLAQSYVCAWDEANAATSDRQQLVARCSSLVSQSRFRESAICLQPFERDARPDASTAAAIYQLGQLYETGRGVPADPAHALRLYRSAERLGAVAPNIAKQASISATKLINRLRQAEEP